MPSESLGKIYNDANPFAILHVNHGRQYSIAKKYKRAIGYTTRSIALLHAVCGPMPRSLFWPGRQGGT
jgi:hypothetical protein